jgi:hypothetical protein
MDTTRSAKDYELEAEASRQRLADSLDELVDRLTPGQVVDEILTYAKAGNGTFFRSLSNATRDNPVPALLIGAGCMMFLSEKTGVSRYVAQRMSDGANVTTGSASNAALRQGSKAAAGATGSMVRSIGSSVRRAFGATGAAASTVGDRVSEAGHSIQEGAAAAAGKVGDSISSAAGAAQRTAHDMRDRAAGAAGKLQEGAASVTGTAQDYASAARDRIKDAAGTAADTAQSYAASARDQITGAAGAAQQYAASAKDAIAGAAGEAYDQGARTAQKATSKAKDLLNEQPLLVAALGLAVGAVIAAALPATRRENELMGEASDSVKRAVSDAAVEQFDAVSGAAGRIAKGVKTAAEQEGLTTSAAVGAAREFGNKIKNVVSGTAESGFAEVRELTGTDEKR